MLLVCNKMAKSQNNASRDCEAVRTQPTGSQSRADIVVDLYCGLGLWVCGTALSSTQLALQPERSENVILARWQETVISPLGELPGIALVGLIVACSTGYAVSCGQAYRRAPRPIAMAGASCIAIVMLESAWNVLKVSSVERLTVALPSMVNVGLMWALGMRAKQCVAMRIPRQEDDEM